MNQLRKVKTMNGKIKDGNLVIELPLQKPEPSKTGKTLIVASSRGVREVSAKVAGKSVFISANAFIYPNAAVKSEEETVVPHRKGRKAVPTQTSSKSRPVEHREDDAVQDDEDEDGY
jgi:hypothetical protein